MFTTTRRQLTSAAIGLTLAVGAFLPGSATAQAAPDEAPAQTIVLHGCVVTTNADTVVFHVGGTGAGPERLVHISMAGVPNYDPATTADACGAIVVYQEDDVWYAESISVSRDDDGDVTVNQNSGSRPVGPRGR